MGKFKTIMPAIKLDELPTEVLSAIIQNLQSKDVFHMILTCKTFMNLIINDNAIWRSVSRTRLVLREHGNRTVSEQSWYDRCRISQNWCKAKYKNRVVINHRTNYMPWLKYHKSEALLLTVGSDLRCYPVNNTGFPIGGPSTWKLTMPKLKRQDVRTDDISRFVLRKNLIVCGNRNGSVAVYKVDDINSRPQMVQYIDDCHLDGDAEVSAVEIFNKNNNAYFVTGSLDSSLILVWTWDMDKEIPDQIKDAGISFSIELFDINMETVKSLALNDAGDKLAIGPDGNSKPILVDMTRGDFLLKSEKSSNVNQIVQDVQWHDQNTLCYVTHFGWVQLMDIRTHRVVYDTNDPFASSFYCVKTDGNHAIVAGTSQHSRCVLFDRRKPFHTQLYFMHQRHSSPVYSLDFDSTKLLAASARGVFALNFDVPYDTPCKDNSDVFKVFE